MASQQMALLFVESFVMFLMMAWELPPPGPPPRLPPPRSINGGWSLTVSDDSQRPSFADYQRHPRSGHDRQHSDRCNPIYDWRPGHTGRQPDVEQ